MAKQRREVIRASEIGEYLFCARAWWLRRALGLEPDGNNRRTHGTLMHQRHGQAVARSQFMLVLAVLLLAGALLVLVLGR